MQTQINIPNRPSNFPNLYELQSHPLAPSSHRKIFLWEMSSTVTSAQQTFNNGAKCHAPGGDPASMGESPLQEALMSLIHHGKAILCCSRVTTCLPMTLQLAMIQWMMSWSGFRLIGMYSVQFLLCYMKVMLTFFSHAFGPELAHRVELARMAALGPEEELGWNKPKFENGEFSGGILFERSGRAVNVSGSPRAYTLAISYENMRSVHAPSPGNKATDHDLENLLLRKELLYVSGPLSISPSVSTLPGFHCMCNGSNETCSSWASGILAPTRRGCQCALCWTSREQHFSKCTIQHCHPSSRRDW